MGCKMAKGQKIHSNKSTKNNGEEDIIQLNEIELQDLNRKELQTYCKKYGIKANAKTAELREKLHQLIRKQKDEKTDKNQNEIREECHAVSSDADGASSIQSDTEETSATSPKGKKKIPFPGKDKTTSANPTKSKNKVKFKLPGKEKLDKDKTSIRENNQRHGGRKQVTSSRKTNDKRTTKQSIEEKDINQGNVTRLRTIKEKTKRNPRTDVQKDVKVSEHRRKEQSSFKTVGKRRVDKKDHRDEETSETVGQEDGNDGHDSNEEDIGKYDRNNDAVDKQVDTNDEENITDGDKNKDMTGKNVDANDDILNRNNDPYKEAQTLSKASSTHSISDDSELSALRDAEKYEEGISHELSCADSTHSVDQPTPGHVAFDDEPVCHNTSPSQNATPASSQENTFNVLSNTQDTYMSCTQSDDSHKESDRDDTDATEINTILLRQVGGDGDPVYDKETRNDTLKSNGIVAVGNDYTTAYRDQNIVAPCDDDTDSVYDGIISDDVLNNTFGLNKTFDVQSSEVTPCLRRVRNATFIVNKGTSEKEISHCDSTSNDDDPANITKSSTLCSRWCVVDGMVKNDREASWKLIKLKGGRPVVPNRFGKYIQFILEPSKRDVPTEYRDNYICAACAAQNEKAVARRDSLKNGTISSTSQPISEVMLSDKEHSSTPKTSFLRNTEVRGSVKRKRGDDGERQSREEKEIHKAKRHKKSSLLAGNKLHPASPTVRKARGEAIELPKNHRNPWRPKVPSRSNTPVEVAEDASYAEKVEKIIKNTIAGSEEELRLMMSKNCLVLRSPTKKHQDNS